MLCQYCKTSPGTSISRFKCYICECCLWCEENYCEDSLPKWVWDIIKGESYD